MKANHNEFSGWDMSVLVVPHRAKIQKSLCQPYIAKRNLNISSLPYRMRRFFTSFRLCFNEIIKSDFEHS